MAASDYVPISFKNRLHLAGRPQMSTRPNKTVQVTTLFIQRGWETSSGPARRFRMTHAGRPSEREKGPSDGAETLLGLGYRTGERSDTVSTHHLSSHS